MCASVGITQSSLKLISCLETHKPAIAEALLEIIEKGKFNLGEWNLSINRLDALFQKDDIPFVNDDILQEDPLQQLYIYVLCSKISDESFSHDLEPFLKLIVQSPMNTALKTFYTKLANEKKLSIPSKIEALSELEHRRVLELLPYLMLAESDWEKMVENMLNLEKSGLLNHFVSNLSVDQTSASVLRITGLFDRDKESNHNLVELLSYIKNSAKPFELEVDKAKELLAKPIGRAMTEMLAEKLLQHPALQKIVMEVYPFGNPENLSLYPIDAKFANNELMLTIIPAMPLTYPDAVFDVLQTFHPIYKIFIRHYASPGIDQGGLSKQFVSQIMQGIRTKSKKFMLDSVVSKNSGVKSLIPTRSFNPSPLMNEEQVKTGKAAEKENYKLLGKFLGLALQNGYPIGQVFDQRLFSTLYLFTDLDLDNSAFSAEDYLSNKKPEELLTFIKDYLAEVEEDDAKKELFEKLQAILTSDNAKAIAEELNEIWYDDDLEKVINTNNLEEIRKYVVQAYAQTYLGRLEVMHAIACGMREIMPFEIGDEYLSKWDDLQFVTTEKFADTLQGRLSVDWIKSNLSFKPKNSEQVKNLKQWMYQWLDEHKDNPEALSRVILTFTGSATIASPIVFRCVEVQSIYPHTCSNIVEVPINIDEESLRAALDAWSEKPEIDVTTV